MRQLFDEDDKENIDKGNALQHFEREKEKIKKYFRDQANMDALRFKTLKQAPAVGKNFARYSSVYENMVKFAIETDAEHEQLDISGSQASNQESNDQSANVHGLQMARQLDSHLSISNTKVIKINLIKIHRA